MKTISLLILIVLNGLFILVIKAQTAKENQSVVLAKEHPELSVNLSENAKAKIFVRKSVFFLQEVMILDIALLTKKDWNYYFPKNLLNQIKLIVRDKVGKEVEIKPSITIDTLPDFEKFGHTILVENLILTIGCKNKVFESFDHVFNIPEEDYETAFERNYFAYLGWGCIDIKKQNELTFYVEIDNNYVLTFPNTDRVKTAVGKLKSNSLRIKIVK